MNSSIEIFYSHVTAYLAVEKFIPSSNSANTTTFTVVLLLILVIYQLAFFAEILEG